MSRSASRLVADRSYRAAHSLAVAAIVLFTAFLSSCSERPVGWGVVLWTPRSDIDTGVVLSIVNESNIQDVYRYAEADTVRELERWRVRLFPDRQQADAFAAAFSALANTYGYAERSGLPVREAAETESLRLYRLREGEVVKVVGRSEMPVEVGAYTNHWYQVLTADGTQGFTFGEFLELFNTTGDPQEESDLLRRQDPVLARLIEAEWRPQYYLDMLASRRIDLTRMTEDYGLTINPRGTDESPVKESTPSLDSAGSAHMLLPDLDLTFNYESIERINEGIYVLQGTGTRIAVQSERRVAVSFQHEGRLQTQVFVTLSTEVSDLISAEQARRELIYDALLESGPLLHSNAYGEILLMPARRFRWSGFQRLVPGVIPADASGAGTIALRLHPLPQLSLRFPGVLTLELDRVDSNGAIVSISFFYRLDEDGIRLVLAGEIDDDLLLVRSVAPTPLTIYFRFGS